VFNILLQIMEDGRLTDAKGRKVDFRNTILIMTSNVGAEMLKRDTSLGFNIHVDEKKSAESSYDAMKDKVLSELKKQFRPEFLNRIDGVMVFHQLSKVEIRQIVDLELKRIHAQLREQELKLEMDDEVKDFLADKGWDQQYGARPLRRAITNLVEDPLAEALLESRFQPGQTVVAKIVEGELKLEPKPVEAEVEPEPEPEPAAASA
jgi:ATP-dependent Clp protease ATP-binding subunit ClpC